MTTDLMTIKMKHIYCISGLGADERVFAKFQFPQHEVHFIKWITPEKKESIEVYAKRLTEQIHHENPILIGLSFGGIMCTEISRQIKVELIIIISSVKFYSELPFWMQLSGKLKLNRLFPMRSFKIIEPIENYNLGVKTKEEIAMVNDYRKNIDPIYSNWAINAILNWKNKVPVKNIYHIHGDKDRIFKIKNIKADYTIKDGGHLMILQRSDEVNKIINSILQKNLYEG
jgi:pimeloyl-ACP methyl ester carboxylesterase